LTALKKLWPELYSTEIAKFSQKDGNPWAAECGKQYSPTRMKAALRASIQSKKAEPM
jgi:hypothetical protein